LFCFKRKGSCNKGVGTGEVQISTSDTSAKKKHLEESGLRVFFFWGVGVDNFSPDPGNGRICPSRKRKNESLRKSTIKPEIFKRGSHTRNEGTFWGGIQCVAESKGAQWKSKWRGCDRPSQINAQNKWGGKRTNHGKKGGQVGQFLVL